MAHALVLAGIIGSSLLSSPALADQTTVLLHLGSTGPSVAALQKGLQKLGYFPADEGITQYYGPITANAVANFKRDHHLGNTNTVTAEILADVKLADKRIPASTNTIGDRIANLAEKYLGAPYVWGGSSPAGFDCSGFTQYVLKQFGINIPRTAAGQATIGTYVSESQLQPGDLVFFNTDGSGISHVGIYIGNGKFISAASSKVEIDSIHDPAYWGSRYVTSRYVSI